MPLQFPNTPSMILKSNLDGIIVNKEPPLLILIVVPLGVFIYKKQKINY